MGFPRELTWNCMAVDNIERQKTINFGSRGGKPNELFLPSGFIHCWWMKWCFQVSQPYSIPRMCPLEYTKEMLSTLSRPPHRPPQPRMETEK